MTILTHLSGCIGLDIVHSKKITSGHLGEITGAEKTTHYSSEFKWAGLYISLIVPIPLIIPYGRESDAQWIKDHKMVYREQIKTKTTGYGCLILVACGGLTTWGNLLLEPDTYH